MSAPTVGRAAPSGESPGEIPVGNTSPGERTISVDTKEAQKAKKAKELRFKVSHGLLVVFFTFIILLHVAAIYLFTTGFLLTRLVLDRKSTCADPPVALHNAYQPGSPAEGCWHPKAFDKAVVLIIDALRYDFTVPFRPRLDDPVPHHYHNAIPLLYETARSSPKNAFLLPFIADPPTTTLQRLKGLTTGTLPTFIDAGSNFAGTAIDEDNLIAILNDAGKNVVHLGDDTWHSLFPGLFDPSLTRPYDSFNVWDLHTVDNGVAEHLIPLLQPSNSSKWDVIFGHFLGVDHAGHRYGPDHPAMTAKLQQMDDFIRQVIDLVDEKTLLVVMGDHGMDSKGDHGGESDDEVEAALWMYSKTKRFGRTSDDKLLPPATAKERPVNQIDLVPTLALLLGLPVPFNNLGAPIEEAFIGPSGHDFENLAAVTRLSSALTRQYQEEYARIRKPDAAAVAPPSRAWESALEIWTNSQSLSSTFVGREWSKIAASFLAYQNANLRMCKDLWARFDVVNMILGISISFVLFGISIIYACGLHHDTTEISTTLLVRGGIGALIIGFGGYGISSSRPIVGVVRTSLASASFGACLAIIQVFWSIRKRLALAVPSSVWSWLCIIPPLLLSIGFASNSYTIWEDEILLFLLGIIDTALLVACLRISSPQERKLGVIHSILFLVLIRLASLSRLCREEQMPYCKSTFYASATSSTSAPWQLAISYLVALILPSTFKNYYVRTQSYHGSAPFWIGVVFRACLFLIAVYWTIDAADDANWFPTLSPGLLKTVRVYIAQFVLVVAAGAGTATFSFQSPFVKIDTIDVPPASGSRKNPTPPSSKPHIIIIGTGNLHGAHFTLLPLTILLIPLLLTQKPMGQGALALIATAILSLLDITHLLSPSSSSTIRTAFIPVTLALLAHFTFFKTGHQAALSSIQWDTAFIPSHTVRYPWSPLMVALNTFAGQILCAAAVPAAVLWRRPYRFSDPVSSGKDFTLVRPPSLTGSGSSRDVRETERKKLLGDVARALAAHVLVYAGINAATSVWAAHLRRHLMLYRVFSPRWMLGCAGLVVAEVVAVWLGLGAVRWSVASVADLFGW